MVKNVDQVAPSQISRRQRRNVHLLVQPFLAFSWSNFPPGYTGQFSSLTGEYFSSAQVLYRLSEGRFGGLHCHLLIRVFWRVLFRNTSYLMSSRLLRILPEWRICWTRLIIAYLAAIADGRGNTDCFPGYVSTSIQTDSAEYGATWYARDTHALLDLLSRRLLFVTKVFNFNPFEFYSGWTQVRRYPGDEMSSNHRSCPLIFAQTRCPRWEKDAWYL